HGYFECHLPLFNDSFFYYDARQFNSLLQFYTTDVLTRLSPQALHRILLYEDPQWDSISLKVNPEREDNWDQNNYQRRYKTLERLAERYPYSKAVRKNISALPDAAWELEQQVATLQEKLIRIRANVLIVGRHGTGKSAVLRQAIRKISNQSRKQKLLYSFWRMIPQRFTATAKYLGEWQEICEDLIEDLVAANGILWVEDIVRLLQIGGEGPEDSVAAYLISFMQQGRLQLVGEVTPQQLESMRRLLPGFVQNFQLVPLQELPEQKIQNILSKFAEFSEKNLKIHISEAAINLGYRLLWRYYPYESFPGKGIKFLGQCVSDAQMNGRSQIRKPDIIDNFIRQTGLPELFLRDDLLLDKHELRQFFASRIIGQPAAIRHLSNVVKVYKAGLNNPKKPISTMLFAGPTGVGKTASARALADYFFGKGQKKSPLIRIDMSEFQYPGQIHRFIGAGKEVGKLVQEIRERPFSVLLLDEVEKAHPAIFDALMTVLDEGMLVDAFGRVTNFRNTIIVMTSNLGASNRRTLGFGDTNEADAQYRSAINSFFRPEFVNRIDEIIFFNALERDDIRKICRKELESLRQREGFTKRGLVLNFSDRVVKHLSKIGFDERYGARPLQRAIEDWLVSPLASWLLAHPEAANRELRVDFDKQLIIK
ncbi:MAG: AAA family ATPase, partial [Bacteroidota bacterium]